MAHRERSVQGGGYEEEFSGRPARRGGLRGRPRRGAVGLCCLRSGGQSQLVALRDPVLARPSVVFIDACATLACHSPRKASLTLATSAATTPALGAGTVAALVLVAEAALGTETVLGLGVLVAAAVRHRSQSLTIWGGGHLQKDNNGLAQACQLAYRLSGLGMELGLQLHQHGIPFRTTHPQASSTWCRRP